MRTLLFTKLLLPLGVFMGAIAFLVLQAKPIAAQATIVVDGCEIIGEERFFFGNRFVIGYEPLDLEITWNTALDGITSPVDVNIQFREFQSPVTVGPLFTISVPPLPDYGTFTFRISARPIYSESLGKLINDSWYSHDAPSALYQNNTSTRIIASCQTNPGDGSLPAFTDGRQNLDVGAPVVIFPEPYGFAFYEVIGSEGVLSLIVECSQIAEVGNTPEQNTLIAESADGRTQLYRLNTGEFQVHFIQYTGAPIYSHIWTENPC